MRKETHDLFWTQYPTVSLDSGKMTNENTQDLGRKLNPRCPE